jgi:branched-chain amino acid transport system ATP-binding protein
MNTDRISIEFTKATVTIGGRNVLDDISFSAVRGERIGLIGANGSGKSSLLNAICAYYPTSSGSIRVNGTDIGKLPPSKVAALGIGRSFQAVGSFEELSAPEYIMVGTDVAWGVSPWLSLITLPRLRRTERRHRQVVRELAEAAGIAADIDRPLRHCPYGVRKIADVIRAVAGEPSVLLLDEPISGVGAMGVPAMKEFIEDYADRTSAAVLMVDHDVGFVSSVCNRLIALSGGKIIADGPKEAVLKNPDVIQTFLGADDVPVD